MSDDQGFVQELFGLFKKHFFDDGKQARKTKKKKRNQAGAATPDVSVGSKNHDSAHIRDAQKQIEVEKLCEKLFQQQDMITSGRLNLIGLDKVRKRYGKSWEGLKHLVYETADSVIRKYMEQGDLFIRYRDDVYLILFAHISHEEAHIKATLIAEEIRRRMFEYEHEELEEVEIRREVRTVATKTLRGQKNLERVYDKIFSGEIDVQEEVTASGRPAPMPESPVIEIGVEGVTDRQPSQNEQEKALPQNVSRFPASDPISQNVEVIEVQTYKDALGTDKRTARTTFDPDFCFLPVWDVKRSALSTYICLLETNRTEFDAFSAHKNIYENLTHKEKLELDKAVLYRAVNELSHLRANGEAFYICCPVHYETLVRDSNFTAYQIACQKIPENLQSHLFFIVFDCPAQVHRTTLAKFAGPLKNYCRFFCAEVPFGEKVDFVAYRSAGFDALGVHLPQYSKGTELVVETLGSFARHAKKHYIPFIFSLGVYSADIISSIVFPEFEFSAGTAIHTHVHKPDRVYSFRYQDHFSQAHDVRYAKNRQ